MIAIAHPDYRPLLEAYFDRALNSADSYQHTLHDLRTAFDFHNRLNSQGTMKIEKA